MVWASVLSAHNRNGRGSRMTPDPLEQLEQVEILEHAQRFVQLEYELEQMTRNRNQWCFLALILSFAFGCAII
jgi:hypothetical protein